MYGFFTGGGIVKDYKGAVRYGLQTIRREWKSSTLWLIFFFLGFFVVTVFGGYGDYLKYYGVRTHVLEPFIWFMDSQSCRLFYVLSCVVIGYMAIHNTEIDSYYLVRMDRGKWMFSRIFHLVGMTCLLMIFLVFMLSVSAGFRIYFTGRWSEAMMVGAQYGNRAIGIEPIPNISYALSRSNVWTIGLTVWCMTMLEGIFAGMIVMVFTLYRKSVYGMAAVGIMWYSSFFDIARFFRWNFFQMLPQYMATVSHTLLGGGMVPVGTSLLCLGVYVAVGGFVLGRSARSFDLK